MKSKHFIFTGLILTFLMFCIYILLFFYQIGAPVRAEYWIYNSYLYKDYKAQQIKKKKIIIIAGSNALFGINSKIIEEKTGYEVINLATHGNLNLDFLYKKLQRHFKKGDIVVMPLEFNHYYKSEKISNWFSNNMMCWGDKYISSLSLFNLSKFIITTKPKRVMKGVMKKIQNGKTNNKKLSQTKILNNLDKIWNQKKKHTHHIYSYKSLNQYGDINIDKKVSFQKNNRYFSTSKNISQYFLTMYKKINKLVLSKNGKLFLTYPVTIQNPQFDLSQITSQNKIKYLENLLSRDNITLQCNAALFNLNRDFFLDTRYHTNKYGALIRSKNLGNCIASLLNHTYVKMTYREALQKTKILEDKYKVFLKK